MEGSSGTGMLNVVHCPVGIPVSSPLKDMMSITKDMTTVSLRFDDNTKKELDEMCAEMGMNLTTFFMIYAKKALRERKIPFMVDAPLKIDENDNYDD